MARKADGGMFVPEAEQPYKIPQNWRWANIGAVADLYTGNSINEKVKKQKYEGNSEGYLYISTKDIGFDSVINYETNIRIPEQDSFKVAPPDTALLCIEGGSAGRKIGFVNQAVCFVNKLCAFRTATVHSKYVFYFLQTHCFESQFLAKKHGLIGGVPIKALSTSIIPIAPLAEQQRIVERIESLFTKLDAAREKAREVVDGFELRKAAILHRAFTGELTEQWRANNGASSGRKTVTIASVCHSLKYGTAKKSAKAGNVVVLRMGNLQGGEIDWSNLAYSNDEEDNEKYSLSPGDVLFNRTNSPELVGKTSIYRGEFPAIYAGYLIKLDYNRDIISGEYLNYMLNSPEAKEYCKTVKTDGVNQSNINAKRIGAFLIPLPSLNEQKETEKRLQSILRKQLQVSETAQQVIDNIDAMKRAILGRAFRGELGTNDPSEASPDFAVTVR